MEVDIMEMSKPDTIKMKLEDDPDATECSSSFGNSRASGRENVSSTSDVEVDSRFCFDDNGFGFDGLENSPLFPPRKKKLTAHWRNFVRPLMWRCRWAELKMKDIQSQASKYDKELTAYDQMKKIEQNQLKVPGFASKSSPWTSSSRMARRKIMKRRKRKRVEDSIDVKSYVSQHCLFSYIENKNSNSDEEFFCKPEQNDNAQDKLIMNEDWLLNNSKDDLEPILIKIENAQSRLRKLKSGLASVISENTGMFSSSENFSLHIPSDAQTSCARFDDFVMAENCHGIAVPDIIESNVGLLTSVDVTTHQTQTQVRDTTEAIMDNVQLHNRVVMESLKNERMKKHSEAEISGHGESSNLGKISASNGNFSSKNGKDVEQKQPKAVNVGLESEISFPKGKRKRGERKPSCGRGWNM